MRSKWLVSDDGGGIFGLRFDAPRKELLIGGPMGRRREAWEVLALGLLGSAGLGRKLLPGMQVDRSGTRWRYRRVIRELKREELGKRVEHVLRTAVDIGWSVRRVRAFRRMLA